MQVPVYNTAGEVVEHLELADSVFAVPFNQALVHQAMIRQRANARQGTASTKTRGEVAGSTRKLYPQKHTGNARSGSIKSPLRRGGGVIFGPHPRSYRQEMPKKMRQQALRCLLSAKASEGTLVVVDSLKLENAKTKEMSRILNNLKVDSSALIVTLEPETNIIQSAANLGWVKTQPAHILNVLDLLTYQKLLITVPAVRRVEELWGKVS